MDNFKKALLSVITFTVFCGFIYTMVMTGICQVLFPNSANGKIIEVNGVKYGSELLGQQYTSDRYMWGRITKIDVSTYKDTEGNQLAYAAPSNLSPASEDYEKLIAQRVDAAKYQVERLARENNMSKEEVNDIIEKCTNHKVLGFFGEETVNVLKVNLMLDKII